MRIRPGLLFATLLAAAVSAHGSTFVIDNFSCPDSVSTTGPVFASNVISCASAIGGTREDAIFFTGGSGSSSSTLVSGSGSITGTIGADLDGSDILVWGLKGGDFTLPDLNLSGDSILIQIESDTGGTLTINLASSSTTTSNFLSYSASFPVSASFVDLLIPLTNPTIIGTGANVDAVTGIGLSVSVPGGGSWTMDGIAAVPEPSTLLLLAIGLLLLVMIRSLARVKAGPLI